MLYYISVPAGQACIRFSIHKTAAIGSEACFPWTLLTKIPVYQTHSTQQS